MFRYYKLLSAFDQYFLLEVHETFCLELALNGECELDDILSLLQVCAVNLTIRSISTLRPFVDGYAAKVIYSVLLYMYIINMFCLSTFLFLFLFFDSIYI